VIKPTDQLLRDACARMSTRFRWVEEFEAVMKDQVRSRLVQLAARHPTAADFAPARVQRQPARRALQPAQGSPPLFDHKRAASGERDDD
jgi:hypothetical protein